MAALKLDTFKYKIVDGKLYSDITRPFREGFTDQRRKEDSEQLLQFATYLFPLPDMEFLVKYDDGDGAGKPIITYTVKRDKPNSGFTMPSFGVWARALGTTQMTAYHACLRERYPVDRRKPIAVWRGSSTGAVYPMDLEHCLKSVRVRLHLLSREHPQLMDTRLFRLVQTCGKLLAPLLNDTSTNMQIEEYNNYCLVLDADGNGWSGRFLESLVHYPTVVLKQASNLTAYAEHLFPPGHAVEQFDPGLTTLMDTVRRIIADCGQGMNSQGQAMIHRKQMTARYLLDHVGVARAMAYTLVTYQRFTAFEPSQSLDGYERLRLPCCGRAALPPEVEAEVNRWLGS